MATLQAAVSAVSGVTWLSGPPTAAPMPGAAWSDVPNAGPLHVAVTPLGPAGLPDMPGVRANFDPATVTAALASVPGGWSAAGAPTVDTMLTEGRRVLVATWVNPQTVASAELGAGPFETLLASEAGNGTYVPLTAATSSFRSVTTTATAAAGEFVEADMTGGAFTVTLPTSPPVGALVAVKKIDVSVNTLTIVPSGGGTIDGDANATTSTRMAGAVFEHKGSNVWRIVSSMTTSGPAGPTGPTGPTGSTGAAGPAGPAGGIGAGNAFGVLGSWYAADSMAGLPSGGNSSQSLAVGDAIFGSPVTAPESMTISEIGAYVVTGGGAGAVLRLGIYQPSAGNPFKLTLSSAYATLHADAGTVAATSSGARVTAALGTPLVLAAGTPFVVVVAAQVAGPIAVYSIVVNGWSGPWGSIGDVMLNGPRMGAKLTGVTGALPATLTPTSFLPAGVGGAGWFKRSA